MSYIRVPSRWKRQPQVPVGLDNDNPLAASPEFCVTGSLGHEIVHGVPLTRVSQTAPRVLTTREGIGYGAEDITGLTTATSNINLGAPKWAANLHSLKPVTWVFFGRAKDKYSCRIATRNDNYTGAAGWYFGSTYFDATYNGLSLVQARGGGTGSYCVAQGYDWPGDGVDFIFVATKKGQTLQVGDVTLYLDGKPFVSGNYYDGGVGQTADDDSGFPLLLNAQNDFYVQGGVGLPMAGVNYLTAAFSRCWSEEEVREFSRNPWQIFKPLRSRVLQIAVTPKQAIGSVANISIPPITSTGAGTVRATGSLTTTLGNFGISATGYCSLNLAFNPFSYNLQPGDTAISTLTVRQAATPVAGVVPSLVNSNPSAVSATFLQVYPQTGYSGVNLTEVVGGWGNAPSGTAVRRFRENAVVDFHYFVFTQSGVNGRQLRFRFELKLDPTLAHSVSIVRIDTNLSTYSYPSARFNMADATVNQVDTGLSAASVSVGSGWYEFTVDCTADSDTPNFQLVFADGGAGSYLGDINRYYELGRIQVEDLTSTQTNVAGQVTLRLVALSAGSASIYAQYTNSVSNTLTVNAAVLPTISGAFSKTLDNLALLPQGQVQIKASGSNALPNIQASATGGPRATGTLASSLPAITLSADVATSRHADADLSFAALGTSFAGVLPIVGSLALPSVFWWNGEPLNWGTDPLTFGYRNTVENPVQLVWDNLLLEWALPLGYTNNTLGYPIGVITTSAAGLVRQTGQLTQTLGFTLTGVGVDSVRGSLAKTLGAITASADGLIIPMNALYETLPAISVNSFGTVVTHGSLNVTLGNITTSTAATSTMLAGLTATLPSITTSATGAVEVVGHTLTAVGSLQLAATAVPFLNATLSKSIGNIGLSAQGSHVIFGALTASIGSLTADFQGRGFQVSAADITLAAVTASSTGTVKVAGALATKLGELTVSSTGSATVAGALAKTLANLSITANGTGKASGSSTATIDSVNATAAGKVQVAGALAKTLSNLSVSGTGAAPHVTPIGNITLVASGTERVRGRLARTLGNITITNGKATSRFVFPVDSSNVVYIPPGGTFSSNQQILFTTKAGLYSVDASLYVKLDDESWKLASLVAPGDRVLAVPLPATRLNYRSKTPFGYQGVLVGVARYTAVEVLKIYSGTKYAARNLVSNSTDPRNSSNLPCLCAIEADTLSNIGCGIFYNDVQVRSA